MQYAPRLPQPGRALVVPLLAAALGAGIATATFALVNIEDQASVSLPSVQSAPAPAAALAGQRTDGGPQEGTAQQAMQQPYTASPDFRTTYQPTPANTGYRYDGGPNEGSSASAIRSVPPAEESGGPQPFGGTRP